MKKFSQRHLLGIKDISKEDIELVFETADNFKAIINRPIKKFHRCVILPLPIFSSKTPHVRVFPLSLHRND
jgi:aspartate carbamoyltransferase catalytic subunit